MKTLIFNGSPRKDGDTAALISALKSALGGDIEQIDAYHAGIRPCIDCRYCFAHDACAVKDGMTRVYSLIHEADNIVIASPVHFSELSGPLLAVLSRLQYFYVSKNFRGEDILAGRKRNGIIMLAGGGDGSPERAIITATCLLHQMGADVAGTVCSRNTNITPAKDDAKAMADIKAVAAAISGNA